MVASRAEALAFAPLVAWPAFEVPAIAAAADAWAAAQSDHRAHRIHRVRRHVAFVSPAGLHSRMIVCARIARSRRRTRASSTRTAVGLVGQVRAQAQAQALAQV